MADVDYPGWCEYLQDMADEFGFNTDSLYDLSCGTGTFLHLFPAKQKFGIDISESMVEEARSLYPDLQISVGNMLHPPHKDADLYINIHDALNYISTFEAIKDHIHYMDTHMKPGQVYVFDFALPGVIHSSFTDVSYEDTTPDGISFKRHNIYDSKNKRSITNLFIYFPNTEAYHEQHVQYIYDYKEIIKLSVEFPSRTFIFLEEFTFEEAHENSNRLLVIMQ